jgi:NitT/TauT family transport system substrate-binding protein
LCSLYYGSQASIFQRAGLNVEVIAQNSGAAAMAALLTGSFQMARVNVVSICLAHLRDLPIKLVAPNVLYSTPNRESLLQIAADATIKTGRDLNGKTIGVVSVSDLNALAAKAWVDKNGGDSRTLKFVEISNSASVPALVQHRVDATIVAPPLLDASLAEGTSKTLGDPMGAIANEYMVTGFVAHSDWVAQHTDTLRRFTRALSESTAYVNTHPAETAQLVSDFTKVDIAVVKTMRRTVSGTRLDVTLIQPVIDVAAKYGMLAHAFPARELLWVDPSR